MADPNLTPLDQLLVAVSERRITRREVMRRAAALGLSLPVLSMLLAACGGDDEEGGAEDTATEPVGDVATEEAGAGEATTVTDAATEAATDGTAVAADSSPEAAGGADASGKVVIALSAEPQTLENWNAYSTDGHPVLRNIQEALLNRDPETNELVGELATAWEQVDDLTWHFTLREGVTFHNGEPLTAEVAAFGITYTYDPENAFDIVQTMGPQITAEAVDEMTVAVKTPEPDPIIPNRLYFAPIPSMQQIQEAPDTLPEEPIGTGPYQFVEWAKGQYIRAERYDDWWGNGADDAYGDATIQEVEWVIRSESSVRTAMVEAGEAQLARFLSPEDCDRTPQCLEAPSVETVFLRFDTHNPVLSDIRIREAIAHAVDKQALAEQIFGGGEPATQLVGPSATGYNPDIPQVEYDPDMAAQLVEEAAADGVPVDQPVIVSVRSGAYNRVEELGEYVAAQLVEIGLNARVEVLEHGAYQEEYVKNWSEVPEDRGWISTLPHGNEMMDLGQSFGYYSCDGAVSTYCSEEVEALIAEALPTTGEERQEALGRVTERFMQDYPIVPLVHMPLFYGATDTLQWEPRLDGFILVKEMRLT